MGNDMGYTQEEVDAIADALHRRARHDQAARITLDKLDAEHRAIFTRAINNVLSTELAVFTYAQIIDGLPTEEVAWDRRMPGILPGISGDHPIDDHKKLCPGALERARELLETWDPKSLRFNPEVCFSQTCRCLRP